MTSGRSTSRSPGDARIEEYRLRCAGMIYSPDVLRHFAGGEHGAIEVEDRLDEVTSPTLVLAGRSDRTCVPEASEAIADGVADSQLLILEASGHMTFVEEPDVYVEAVSRFLGWDDDG